MIGWLQGQLIDKREPGKCVLNVNGVGYDVETSLQTFFKIESQSAPVELLIHTVVREDAFILYGFADNAERDLFRALIKVNGVGPKLALAILSSTTPCEFKQCIQDQNTQLLTRLPGIGKRTAERLVVEMRDKLEGLVLGSEVSNNINKTTHQEDAAQALEALGYRYQEAKKALQKVEDSDKSSEQLIKDALKILAGSAIS